MPISSSLSAMALALIVAVSTSAAIKCSATLNCVVDCSGRGFGPEAPDLSEIIPPECHGRIIPELNLEDNAISIVRAGWLGGWDIQTLNLGYNSLKDIQAGSFEANRWCILQRLFLHRNYPLGANGLRKNMFRGLECSLARLNLDGTSLQTKDLKALGELRYLEQLHLTDNGITIIPEGVLANLTILRKIVFIWKCYRYPILQSTFQRSAFVVTTGAG